MIGSNIGRLIVQERYLWIFRIDPTEYRKWAESNNQKNNDRDFWIEVIESRTIRRKKVC